MPERILDAPSLIDDFYLNCLEWGVRGELAVALGGTAYLWTQQEEGSAGGVRELVCLDSTPAATGSNSNSHPSPNNSHPSANNNHNDTLITSLSFIHDGTSIALGTNSGRLHIWDIASSSRIRTIIPNSQTERIPSISWNKQLVSVGCKSGLIATHDVRSPPGRTLVWDLQASAGEVCGLKWSWDGTQLAAGTNDNQVVVCNAAAGGRCEYTFAHNAAVKALAWSPWQSGLLASGGGSADRSIKMTCCKSGRLLHCMDAGSQVSGIMWSKTSKEFVSTHGFADNAIKLWRYSSASCPQQEHKAVAMIEMAHDQRILHTALSPCGQELCTAGADECIKFWKLFGGSGKGEDDGDAKLLVPKLMPTFAKNKKQHQGGDAEKKKSLLWAKK